MRPTTKFNPLTHTMTPHVFALVAALFVFAFPTPRDLAQALSAPLNQDEPVAVDGGDDRTPGEVVEGTNAVLKASALDPVVTELESSGCVEDFASFGPAKIERCSEIITRAVVEVAKFEAENQVQNGPPASADQAVTERLRLAATRVCRAEWASVAGNSFDFASPVCAASTLRLASAD